MAEVQVFGKYLLLVLLLLLAKDDKQASQAKKYKNENNIGIIISRNISNAIMAIKFNHKYLSGLLALQTLRERYTHLCCVPTCCTCCNNNMPTCTSE